MNTCRQLLLVVLLLACLSGAAGAQTAPEGNVHPAPAAVSAMQGAEQPPFGPIAPTTMTPFEKSEFAAKVDVSPLRDLAVLHSGRVKVLDTLAGETVRGLSGRRTYQDFLKPQGATPEREAREVKVVNYDPLFTLLDLAVDPGYYHDKALLGVDYLPLRKELLASAFPDDDAARERWLKVGRITPDMFDAHAGSVAREHVSEEGFRSGLMRIDRAFALYEGTGANFLLVAPEAADKPWTHLSLLPADHPARAAALALGAAWRAGDADAVNRHAATLAAELPRINAAVYPTTSRSIEGLYNRVRAFEWGFWAYGFGLVTLLMAFGTGRKWVAWVGAGFLAIAIAMHSFGFVSRCLIAERFAIQNQFESMTGLSLFAVLVATVIMMARRQWLFGAAACAVGFLVLITATQTAIPGKSIEREAAILNTSVLLKYHVTTVLASYGLILLGFVGSLFFLGVHYAARLGRAQASPAGGGMEIALGAARGSIATRDKLLHDLDSAQMILLQLAFWTLGVGILLGAWWADHSWGRWWAFDPKETWALITWIVYLIVIHVRIGIPAKKGLVTAWLSVVGFFIMLWTYFGVNLLLPGLHAYA
ncbi:MAG: cytochrome c biogenesis protein CcsA [Phycisphaerales bacterium]